MISSVFLLAPSVLSNEVAFTIALGDLLLKSMLVVAITGFVTVKGFRWLGNAGAFLVWVTGLVCLLLIPLFSTQLGGPVTGVESTGNQLSLFTVPLYQNLLQLEALDPMPEAIWWQAIVFIYLTVLIFLLLTLWVSIGQVSELVREGFSESGCLAQSLLRRLLRELDMAEVKLCFCEEAEAPFSYNLRRPVIVLPVAAFDWDAAKLESVLVHELEHIRRNDGRLLLACQLLTYVFWFNPFAWYVMKKIRTAAEFNCDDGVLSRGASNVRYAEELVSVARNIMNTRKRRCFLQYMIDAREIRVRIENIMQRHPVKKAFSATALAHCLLLTLIVGTAGLKANIVDTRYRDFVEAGRVVYSERPEYPLNAYQAGIEGWVLVEFDVDARGLVAQNSIDVQFSQPVGVFEDASLEALSSFQFKARRVNGRPVASEDHRYMFRFRLPPR